MKKWGEKNNFSRDTVRNIPTYQSLFALYHPPHTTRTTFNKLILERHQNKICFKNRYWKKNEREMFKWMTYPTLGIGARGGLGKMGTSNVPVETVYCITLPRVPQGYYHRFTYSQLITLLQLHQPELTSFTKIINTFFFYVIIILNILLFVRLFCLFTLNYSFL